jgi:hypothetical protein
MKTDKYQIKIFLVYYIPSPVRLFLSLSLLCILFSLSSLYFILHFTSHVSGQHSCFVIGQVSCWLQGILNVGFVVFLPVSIGTRYGLRGSGIELSWCESILIRPVRPWGPPFLLYSGHRISCSAVKQSECGVDHTTHLAPGLKKKRAIGLPLLPVWAFMACSKLKFTLTLPQSFQAKTVILTPIRPRPFHFTYFQIRYSLIILSFDALHCEILVKASIDK